MALVGGVSGAAVGTMIADGPGAVVGAAVGAVWGAIAGYFAQDQANAAFLDAKDAYAQQLVNVTNNYLGLAHAGAQNQINTYNLSTYFFARKAEWAALQLYNDQTENGYTHTYNPYYVLSRSEVANGTMAAVWAIAAQYEAILNQFSSLTSQFVGTYDGMTWGYKQFGGYTLTSSLNSHPTRIVKVVSEIMTLDSATTYVTLSAGSPIYLYGNSDNVTITSRLNGVVYSEANTGLQEVYVEESGDYSIVGAGIHAYALCIQPISNAAVITPTIISMYEQDGKAVLDGTGKVTDIWFGDVTKTTSLAQITTDLAAIMTKARSMQVTSNALAQAYYNTLVANGGGENRILPDIVFPDPNNLAEMTPEQIYAIYLAYLNQQQDWFRNYTVQNPGDVLISENSLFIKCRGSLYASNGTLLMANTTVFSPYISLDDMTLVIGNNTMTQPGFMVIWGTAATLADFEHLSDITYYPLSAGMVLNIEEMELNGTAVDEIELKVTTVELVVFDHFSQLTPPQGASDWEWLLAHWYWFVLILGAIVLVGAVFLRNTPLAVIGLVLAVVGAGFWIVTDWSSGIGLLSGWL